MGEGNRVQTAGAGAGGTARADGRRSGEGRQASGEPKGRSTASRRRKGTVPVASPAQSSAQITPWTHSWKPVLKAQYKPRGLHSVP